mmetsp:Transcript_45167/g.51247  ORF Transcript_45167/g.51247 Transcript_45167/m.51247 type:complete len:426 (+) Transcript_45167:84-1361(+)
MHNLLVDFFMTTTLLLSLSLLLLSQEAIQSASAFVSKASTGIVNVNSNNLRRSTSITCRDPHPRSTTLLERHAQEFEGELIVSRTITYDNDKDDNGNNNDDNGTTNTKTCQYPIRYHIHNKMNLSSQQAAPILVVHGGPGIPSDYLLPLREVIPYRSLVFYDQLGCGRSSVQVGGQVNNKEEEEAQLYSIEASLDDLELLIQKSGLTRFHLYGQSFGGILAFEYMKRIAERNNNDDNNSSRIKCLSAILSSTPCDDDQVESVTKNLIDTLLEEDSDESTVMDRFQARHVCRTTTVDEKGKQKYKQPPPLAEAYENNPGTPGMWRGTDSIPGWGGWTATPPKDTASRMPSCMILHGEYDFVTADCVQGWKKQKKKDNDDDDADADRSIFNHPYVRVKELEHLSHHGLLEDGKRYGEIVDSFFLEYD